MPIFTNTSPNTSTQTIQIISDSIGFPLPPAYVEHLIQYNGGKCLPNIFDFVEAGETTSNEIRYFLNTTHDHQSIQHYIAVYKKDQKRMPSYMVPIATDDLGNLICISCLTNTYGFIYFWNHDEEVNYHIVPDNDESNLTMLSYSIDAFLASLREYHEDE